MDVDVLLLPRPDVESPGYLCHFWCAGPRFEISNDCLEIGNPLLECGFLFGIKSGRERLAEKSPDLFECEECFECFLDPDTHDVLQAKARNRTGL